jgi:hypothetical protein
LQINTEQAQNNKARYCSGPQTLWSEALLMWYTISRFWTNKNILIVIYRFQKTFTIVSMKYIRLLKCMLVI